MKSRPLLLLVIVALAVHLAPAIAQSPDVPASVPCRMELPDNQRSNYRNPDGSCVQCSIGMCGMWMADDSPEKRTAASATNLLWDSEEYGPKVRGGSYPSRVEEYAKRRGMAIYNVTGSATYEWMRWAAKTGRFAAIGFATAHFQTEVGWNPNGNRWYVCDNNSPRQIDEYSWEQYVRTHKQSGEWVVVLDAPPPPAVPRYVEWWR